MKSTFIWVVVGTTFLLAGSSVNAWGGIYTNRFSPEMLQNMGYGGGQHRLFQAEVSCCCFCYGLLLEFANHGDGAIEAMVPWNLFFLFYYIVPCKEQR